MSIPKGFIDQLLDQVNIVDVIGRRLPLEKKVIDTGVAAHFMMKKHLRLQYMKILSFIIVSANAK